MDIYDDWFENPELFYELDAKDYIPKVYNETSTDEIPLWTKDDEVTIEDSTDYFEKFPNKMLINLFEKRMAFPFNKYPLKWKDNA